MKKLKRGVGRPPKEMQHIFAMQDAQAEAKGIFADTYLDAVKYMAALVTNNDVSPNLRFTAAKAIKEQVEEWLLEQDESLLEDDEDEVSSSPTKISI